MKLVAPKLDNVNAIMAHLEKHRDERGIELTRRMVEIAEPFFGISLTDLKALAKLIRRNHKLAAELWDTGCYDARLLSSLLEDPKKINEKTIDKRVHDARAPFELDKFVMVVVAKTPWVMEKIKVWTQAKEEFVKRAGFALIYEIAKQKYPNPDSFFIPYLEQIEAEIQSERNWVKEMMNNALISIGSRNASLNERALAIAYNLGPVVVDYGTSACSAPDAIKALKREVVLEKIAKAEAMDAPAS